MEDFVVGRKQRLEVVYPHCAGIDVGGTFHMVAIDPQRAEESGEEPVRRFEAYTDELEAMANWLRSHGVTVVALEATGVYWIAPFEVLERHGFEVHLVSSRACKQVSGRKSDVLDCQWIQRLMSYGLLRGAFRPADEWCAVRSYVRQHAGLVRDQARSVQQMQKALTQMNLQLANVLSDITGKTGMAILRAIVAGERDGSQLARLRDPRVRADAATIARSLTGNWREEHLYALAQALARHDFFATQLRDCEGQILNALEKLPATSLEEAPLAEKRCSRPDRSQTRDRRLRAVLRQALGVDLTAIPTIGTSTAMVVATELGRDLSRFPDSAHFSSWLTLAPSTRISGGKPLGGKGSKAVNRVGEALKLAAANARRSDSFIGASHRARLMRMDKATAIKATAHQLARLIYAMLTQGQPYVEKGIEQFEDARRQRQRRSLERRARALGLVLCEADAYEKSVA